MQNRTLFDWTQLAMSVAVVVGLILVVVELRQSHSIARQQAASSNYSDMLATQLTYLGEDFSVTLAKACARPGELTDDELLQMQAYRNVQLITIVRLKLNQEIAGFSYDWRRGADGPLKRWLYTPVARAQLEVLEGVDPDLLELAEDYIDRNPDAFERCLGDLSRVRSSIVGGA